VNRRRKNLTAFPTAITGSLERGEENKNREVKVSTRKVT
jgi:hypothetical protein